jgi:prevent-host-death family protein
MVVGSFEAKTKLAALLDRVQRGEEVTITRHGKPVARLVPIQEEADTRRERKLAAIEWIRKFRETHTTSGESVKDWIEEGRR